MPAGHRAALCNINDIINTEDIMCFLYNLIELSIYYISDEEIFFKSVTLDFHSLRLREANS